MPVRSKLEPIVVPDGVTLWPMLQTGVSEFLDRTALTDADTASCLSFRQLLEDVKKVSGALWELGLRKGDVLLVFSTNAKEVMVVSLALFAIGAIFTGCNPTYKADELSEQVDDSGALYVLTTSQLLPVVRQVKLRSSSLKGIIALEDNEEGCIAYRSLVEYEGPAAPWVPIDPSRDVAALFYSSGTTGKPKGVMHTHSTLAALLLQMGHHEMCVLPSHGPQNLVIFMPLYHLYGYIVTYLHLLTGHCTVLMRKFNFHQFLYLNSEYKCPTMFLVPPVAVLQAKQQDTTTYDLSHVTRIFSASAPLSQEVDRAVSKRFNLQAVTQLYGLSELISHSTSRNLMKPSSVGVLMANTECKVIDAVSNEEVGPNKRGELLLRGPQMMAGYWRNRAATSRAIDGHGWLHTGDVGYYDDDGHFYIVDRVKELIKYKGHQVAPAWLEDLLLGHPDVQDAGVVGLPDDEAGELPLAFVVLKPGHAATEQHIQQFVKDRVAPIKQLRGGVRFVPQIPKSATGKIMRRVLRESVKQPKSLSKL